MAIIRDDCTGDPFRQEGDRQKQCDLGEKGEKTSNASTREALPKFDVASLWLERECIPYPREVPNHENSL